MQAPQSKPPRGVTIGIAVELFGIAFAMFGLSAQYTGVAGGQFWSANPTLVAIGATIAFAGLLLHIARI